MNGPMAEIVHDARLALDALGQLLWVIDNTEGVVGLNVDGSTMSWPDVIRLYAPAVTP